ncbi:MAG: PAS-domain containing protein [Qipengyuania citrea]|jgi:signal transduction histidine kinase|uniref:histidine kinase n=4 Tax=Erythrobacteraceae TaxID=335929 RepID=A0A0L1KF02_9SPHN|nr:MULTISPECIES: PAS domain-containing sensor histidine kinase [Erythrobacteraceae]MAG07080.1 two-component sensor histidine kinase [Sphingomonadaceae bacterium]HAN89330.1 PAS domain-containing protein [Erythrobacter sp.]KNH02481.1 histidine kinase [Qipengyuania citrea LAMA 915]KZZ08636.1 histidine kinase [Erythrobacter sp. HI0077]HCJ81536.1 PAS domain-containing protein [Erythrobacter sp.]|tara:strand:- start:93 stop:2438 length:2346 start_codon:yes stop_codon:yes gene_type:complete
MDSSPALLAVIGLLLALWTAGAVWVMLRASGREQRSIASRKTAQRLSRLIEEGPAIPLLVRADGRIEAPDRLARWIGLEKVPEYLSELAGGEGRGLTEAQIDTLTRNVRRTQKTAKPFRMAINVSPDSGKSLALQGSLADPAVSPGGSALVWVFDFSDSQAELTQLREEAARAREDFGALVGLIEAAPMPMWFRGADMQLRLVNQAYVAAVGAESADQVVADQVELVETVNGRTAAEVAQQAADRRQPIERILSATIERARRTIRVTDLPLMGEGIAGYAVDIEEMEEQAREFRAFREAQRSMLDQLSIGVAQFDAGHRMTFANQPFHRVFSLPPGVVNERTSFGQMLLIARENGRIPEVRDFPAWRNELTEWFQRDEPHEEAWPLSDSTHLRIVAQPLPDGGLVMIAEDRTEQLALSATRDTLLRTRTATFDNLFEALAVFAPDGHLELWNRGFPGAWGIDPEVLDGHPQAEDLLQAISRNLSDPASVSQLNQVIRAATLDRKKSNGRIELADGRTLDFTGVPLPDGNGMLTVLDVTASQQAEVALRERNRALEEADAVMTRFLANMSYEFRTPLTSIGGFAELLTSGIAGELSPQATEYAQAISLSVGKLTEQVENVLDLSQSEAGLMPLRKSTFTLLPFLTKIVRKEEQRIHDGELTLDLKGDAEKSVTADPHQLRRAISQLLDNAINGTPRGGRIAIDIGRKRDETRIVISDNGRGMSQHELARALEGIRMSSDGKGIERRHGLGIPLARQLVEAHGGTLEIRSRKNSGTTATITLP